MATYHSHLVIANEDEWIKHLEEIVERNNNADEGEKKTEDELVQEAFDFDFKFDTVLDFISE